jgi:hypothetical protein
MLWTPRAKALAAGRDAALPHMLPEEKLSAEQS